MPASKGMTGKGTVFSMAASGGQNQQFVDVAQLKTASFSGQKINFDDLSNLGSPTLGTSNIVLKENAPATADAGTTAIAGVYLPMDDGQKALMDAYRSQTLQDFKIQLPKGPGQAASGNLFTFSGYVAEQPLPDIQWDKYLGFKTTIQLTTELLVTPGN